MSQSAFATERTALPDVAVEPFANGWFTLAVTSNGASAVIKKIVRHSGQGKPVTLEDILKKMKKEKVVHGIDMAAIHGLLQSVENNVIPEDQTVIARSDVENGENGSLEWLIQGLPDNVSSIYVAPGTRIAVRKPASRGKPGKNVYGKRINPRPGFDPQLEAGTGISLNAGNDGEIIYQSKSIGILDLDSGTVSVTAGIRITEDKLQAHMNIRGSASDGTQIVPADVLSVISAAGIRHGIIEENITRALDEACRTGKTIENVLIAEGKAPLHGKDAVINWHLDIRDKPAVLRSVLPGQLIADHIPETRAEAGMNIHGEPLPAQQGTGQTIINGAGIVVEAKNGRTEFRSEWLGTAQLDSDTLTVTPDIEIADDNMSVTMGLYTRAGGRDSEFVSYQHVLQTLTVHGVKSGLRTNEIAASLKKARSDDRTHFRMTVASGTPPCDGVNARLVIDEKISSGRLLSDGSIDYHEKSYPWNVKTNDVIGHVIPRRVEKNGISVTGEIIKAIPAEELKLILDGVTQGKDGKLRAAGNGILLIEGLKIRVTDNLVINGDIDQNTGNINTDTTVVINGYVKPGYTVKARKGDVVVQENVEDGYIYARGSIVIKTGIRGTRSEIASAGNIRTTFSENARLMTPGNVVVTSNVIGCDIWCKGNMKVGESQASNSSLIGGITRVGKCLEVTNLGADSYNRTVVLLGPSPATVKRYRKMTEQLEERKQEMNDLEKLYKHYKQEPGGNQKMILQKIAKTGAVKSKECERLRTRQQALHGIITKARQARIIVRKNVFPGVVVQLLGQTYEVKEKRGPGAFHLNGDHIIFEQS